MVLKIRTPEELLCQIATFTVRCLLLLPLYWKVKMVLDRLTKFSVPVSMRTTINLAGVKPLPNLPQRATKPQYDRATHAIFASAIRGMVQSQKGIKLDR